MFYKLYVLRDFFWQPSLIKLESSSEKQQAHNILSRFTIAANFWKGVVEQDLGLLHHVSKDPWCIWRAGSDWNRQTSCKYFLSESGSEACMLDEMFVFDQIQLSWRKLAVGTSGWLPEHYFNIWIPRCVLFVIFCYAHRDCDSTSTGFCSLARLDSSELNFNALIRKTFWFGCIATLLQHWTFLRRLVCQPNIF